jgi:hypothetical protein
MIQSIRFKKYTSKKRKPANEISDSEVKIFVEALQNIGLPYPKVRNLNSVLKNKLDEAKVNTILHYLERSKKLEIDLDGNIIWMSAQEIYQTSLAEKASFSSDFIDHLKSRRIYLSSSD